MAIGECKRLFSFLLLAHMTCLLARLPGSCCAGQQSDELRHEFKIGRAMVLSAPGSSGGQERGRTHVALAAGGGGRRTTGDTLVNGGNITDGETLVSANGTFITGLFSPGASSTNRYLGTWYSVSPDVVCWVANRDKPLNSASGVLSFDAGRLLLVDGSSGETIWSSTNSSTPTEDPAVAQLLDSGNLVIRRLSNEEIVWQSFEHPSDTLLPGMKMGSSNWTGQHWYLTAWRSPDDPSPGTYRDSTELNGLPENVLRDHRGVMLYRTGAWNGLRYSGVTEASTYAHLFAFQMTITAWEVSFGYIAKPGAPLSRLVMTSDGFVKRLVWEASRASWVSYHQGPRDVCDSYNMCGPFGVCNADTPSTSFCSCVKGFSPVNPAEWLEKETSGGCQRTLALDCGGNNGSTTDGFLMLQGIKLPDARNASVDRSMTLESCSASCLGNCLCVAYAPADISGGGAGRGCIMWTDRIIDLRYVDGGQDLYLRLARPELGGHTRNKPSVSTIATAASIAGVIVFIVVIVTVRVVMRKMSERAQGVPSVSLSTVKRATENFSSECLIGHGGFGYVYKGKLPNGHRLRGLSHRSTTVAVKRMYNRSKKQGSQEDLPDERILQEIMRNFDREVKLMSRLTHHENVARLLGLCKEDGERILLYEYAHRGSLNTYIFGTPEQRKELSWEMRLKIIYDIAKGVTHLHKGSNSTVIIHRDLKPANVLLDDNWVAKVADFGTAKIFNDQTGSRSSVVIGTIGYMAPEYQRNATDLTPKCDVYSFGVTLLKTISGKNAATPMLLHNARQLWDDEGNALDDFLESTIGKPSTVDLPRIRRCIQIGVLCVQETPDHRPDMPEVVEMLTNSSEPLRKPNPPNGGTLARVLEMGVDPPNQEPTDQPCTPEAGGDDPQNNQVTREITEVLR